MAKLGRAHVMLAQEMVDRSVSVRQVATQLGVDESTLRYRLKRPLTSGAALAHLLIWIIVLGVMGGYLWPRWTPKTGH